jgi:hypothetical protein
MPANPFDKAARFAAKIDAPEFLAWALELPPDRIGFSGWLDTRAIPFPVEQDQISDTVARLDLPGGGEPPWAVAVEFQIEPDPLMFSRLLAYLAQLWQTMKPDSERGSRFKVGAAVLNLTGNGNATYEMRLPGTAIVTHLAVVERNLARESADDTVREIEAGESGRSILPWVPLMADGDDETIIERWKRLAEREPNSRRRSEYGGLALVFAEAADRREQWELALKGWNVKESIVVNRWRAEAKAEGLAEGQARGRAEGQLAERVASLLDTLTDKFGAAPEDLVNAIRACTDLAKLRQWASVAIRADTLGAFRAAAGV